VFIIIGVVRGLAHLHHKCNPTIVHLDIKPQNILLDKDYTPKLVDFGLAKILDGKDEKCGMCPTIFIFLFLCMIYLNAIVKLANLNTLMGA
jgi:serine/threonine protein kinase